MERYRRYGSSDHGVFSSDHTLLTKPFAAVVR